MEEEAEAKNQTDEDAATQLLAAELRGMIADGIGATVMPTTIRARDAIGVAFEKWREKKKLNTTLIKSMGKIRAIRKKFGPSSFLIKTCNL